MFFNVTNFSRRQLLVIIGIMVVNLFNAMCYSMQAPFYPKEADKKGIPATQYGFVFGIYELVVFLVSPIIGINLKVIGIKRALCTGIGAVSLSTINFGLLQFVKDPNYFLVLSFALRILAATGNATFVTGSFSLMAKEFPDKVATMFSILETFFGLGMITGPFIGGLLYEAGKPEGVGFLLPFLVLGLCLLAATLFVTAVLPNTQNDLQDNRNKPSITMAIKIPSIMMSCYSVACASASLAFLEATLESHLREYDMNSVQVGAMFIINGGVYGVVAPIFGMICDRKPPKLVALIGALSMVISFSLIGPLPFLRIEKSKNLIICCLVLHGIGLGAQFVSGFADAHRQAILNGFPDTIDTYGMISGIWTSVFALGAFIGPSLAGVLLDTVGFSWATMLIVGNQLVVVALLSMFLCFSFYKPRVGYEPIGSGEDQALLNEHRNDGNQEYESTFEGNMDNNLDESPEIVYVYQLCW